MAVCRLPWVSFSGRAEQYDDQFMGRYSAPGGLEAVEVSSLEGEEGGRPRVPAASLEDAGNPCRWASRVPAGKAVRLAPRDWNSVKTTKIESSLKSR